MPFDGNICGRPTKTDPTNEAVTNVNSKVFEYMNFRRDGSQPSFGRRTSDSNVAIVAFLTLLTTRMYLKTGRVKTGDAQ